MSKKGLKRYKVLTFDMVGTLIDFETGVLDYIRPVAKEAGLAVADPAILEAYGWAEEKLHKAAPNVAFTEKLGRTYLELAGVLGLPSDETVVDGFKKSLTKWPAFADVGEALQTLGRRYRLVALTNADNWGYWYLNKTLGEPFDDKVTAENVGVDKPDPQMFAYCLGRLSVDGIVRGDILHVAHSQFQDIGVASRLGYATAWIERHKGREGLSAAPEPDAVVAPTYTFSSLNKLAQAVEEAFKDA
jgi:putative hydrolase of the HAD superfamily